MGKSIVITGGKGGVGKSVCTANIGSQLAKRGKRVILADADIGLRNLDILLGMQEKIVYDIVDVAKGICSVEKAILKDKRENLFFMPAAQGKNKDVLNPTQMKNVVSKLKESFDYVLIDCPAGIEKGFENAVSSADLAIVVINPEETSIRDADRVISLLDKYSKAEVKLLVNKFKVKLAKSGKVPAVDEMIERLSVTLLGIVPEYDFCDSLISDKRGIAQKAFYNIAGRLDGETLPIIRPFRGAITSRKRKKREAKQ